MNRRQFLAGVIATTAIVPIGRQEPPWKRYIERHRRKTQAATREINRILGVPQNTFGVGYLERIGANEKQANATAICRLMMDAMVNGQTVEDRSIVFGKITSA